jgi:integral membrane protein (TIGR01906 family)
MPERGSGWRRLEAAVAAAAIVLVVVGQTLLPLTTPLYVRTLVSLVRSHELTGLDRESTLDAAETVRRFVLDADAPPLPERIEGRAAFDRSASEHLVDVRNVMVPARTLTLVASVIVILWLALRHRDKLLVASALRGAAAAVLVTFAVAGLVGLADFDAFFTWFHGLFFAEGTWMFPAEALLIRIFPLPFWMAAAATWAALLIMSGVLMFTFAHHLRVAHERTVYSHGGA